MIPILLSLALFFIMLCVYLYHIIFKDEPYEKVTKTSTSILFFTTGIVSALVTSNFSAHAVLICLGLFFSIFGDFFLIKKLKIKHSFITGVLFFSLAQVSYIVAFSLLSPITVRDFVMFFLIQGAALVAYKLLKYDARNLKIPLLIYSSLLTFMTVKAISVIFLQPYGMLHAVIAATGAVLFLLSDVILSHSIFTLARTQKARLANLLTYYFGQILIAFSIYLMFTG